MQCGRSCVRHELYEYVLRTNAWIKNQAALISHICRSTRHVRQSSSIRILSVHGERFEYFGKFISGYLVNGETHSQGQGQGQCQGQGQGHAHFDCEYLADGTHTVHIAIANKYKVAYGLSIDIFRFDLDSF